VLALALISAACTSQGVLSNPTQSTSNGDPETGAETNADPESAGTPSQATSVVPDGSSLTIDIERVSDGDSVRASSTEGDLEIRLIGINAPEQDECFGDRSTAILEELLTEASSVQIHPWPPELDDFGRELGFLVADGQFVNLALIEQGAVVARAQSDHEFAQDFEDAESIASDAGRGLWARDACGEPSDAQLVFVDAVADAPGNDQENPNGEWVEIENIGPTETSLNGWSLRDESTRHRYEFPDVSIAAGQRIRIFTGCGDDRPGGATGELFWCDPEPPVWNNGGDTAFLLDVGGAIADSLGVGG